MENNGIQNRDQIISLLDTTIRFAIRNGVGLTQACENVGLNIIDVSSVLKSDDKILNTLKEESRKGFQKAVSIINNLASDKDKGEQWLQASERLKSLTFKIVLWEEISKKDNTKPAMIAAAMNTKMNKKDAATAFGMTEIELEIFILKNQSINGLIRW